MHLTRRSFFSVSGAALALRADTPPKRFAVVFMGNGVNGNHWWAKGAGANMQLSRSLQPLEPVKHQVNIISGLFHPASVGNGIHHAQTVNLLSGVGRVLAQHLGCRPLALTCDPTAGVSHISSPAEFVPKGAIDILAEAFQKDRTRVAVLTLAADRSSLRYPFLGVPGDHHTASHDDLSDAYERIVRFHVGQFAHLVQRLDSMPEGRGAVLDNCCLLFLSNMWSGWKHDNRKLPVLTAGGLAGTFPTGRALEYLYAGDENRKLCSLYLSILDRFGLHLGRFGDATTRLV